MADPNESMASETLCQLLSAHGLNCAREQEWIVPNNELPALRALWHPQKDFGRLDVHVALEKGRVIEECFAGIGTGHGGRQFTAYIGNFGTRASAGIDVAPPKDLFETIQRRILQEDLPAGTHWFRVFFCNAAGAHTYEALRDNEPWEAGVAGLKGIAWPETDGYYSFRNFIVLRSA
jgi:hypothetical protein